MRWRALGSVLASVALLGSCFAEPAPYTLPSAGEAATGSTRDDDKPVSHGGRGGSGGKGTAGMLDDLPPLAGADAGGDQSGPPASCPSARPLDPNATCWPLQTSEPLPARVAVTSAVPTDQTFFTRDLYTLVSGSCTCHSQNTVGGVHFGPVTFPDDVTDKVLEVIKSDDPTTFMPPPPIGKPFSTRTDDDITQIAKLLEIWIAQGKPADTFVISAAQGGMSPFKIPTVTGENLTNLGSCVPDAGIVGTEYDRMCQMDAFFASLERKPPGEGTAAERLGLPERLEATDLNSFDTEALARQGVVAYAPAYPLWSDDAGKIRMVRVPLGETIRYDKKTREFDIPPNTRFYKTFLKKTIELDGVERWRKVETRVIVARPATKNADGTYEQQALFGTYKWSDDESEAKLLTNPLRNGEPFSDVIFSLVTDEPLAEQIKQEHPEAVSFYLQQEHALRHYAIPGSERCKQCHMGSIGQSFVLGFAPLQVNRRPLGEGGTIADSGPDELTQLERLVDYGIVSGLDPKHAPKLEESQLPRKPRNDYELTAQSYMFGNCGHCHNPNGFPSVSNPALVDLLRFWPSADGGIFEFPLERVSPRIHRGEDQTVPIAYVNPELTEMLPGPGITTITSTWKPKSQPAPWRAAIYRNVDTPFTYSDDYAIYPHMPMNTSGYDCRAPRIIGSWMASIPVASTVTIAEQPLTSMFYKEVKPDDVGYRTALAAAERRVDAYQKGPRYTYCPDTSDIQDPEVLDGDRVAPADDEVVGAPSDNVPDRPHYAPLDLTDTAGDWEPRRADWNQIMIDRNFGPELDPGLVNSHPEVKEARDSLKEVVEIVRGLSLSKRTAFKEYALTEQPFGLWKKKDGCDFSSAPKLGSFTGERRARWMDNVSASADAPVYTELPGSSIYGLICVNCHGEQADSKGRQAATLSDMTGGSARVANFRTGLFGGSGANVARVFGPELEKLYTPAGATANVKPTDWSGDWPGDPVDWAARYMPWMALGGTLQKIPPAVTNLVAGTQVLGEDRVPPLGAGNVSANMLAVAQRICQAVLPLPGTSSNDIPTNVETGQFSLNTIFEGSGLILDNGDAELWERICNFDNPAPIRALKQLGSWQDATSNLVINSFFSFYGRAPYPVDAVVGDHTGHVVTGVHDDNRFPWCVIAPTDPAELTAARAVKLDGGPLPFCPDALLAPDNRWKNNQDYRAESGDQHDNRDDLNKWAKAGAVNAGQAVFLYLQQLIEQNLTPKPRYDQCEKLSAK